MDNIMRKNLGSLIEKKRKEKGWSQRKLSMVSDISNTTISRIEKGETKSPDVNTLKKIALHLNTSYDELMASAGYIASSIPPTALSEKEERDIAKDLEAILAGMDSSDSLSFYGEPLDEATKQLMRISLENSMKMAKQIAKQKFTSKKYKELE